MGKLNMTQSKHILKRGRERENCKSMKWSVFAVQRCQIHVAISSGTINYAFDQFQTLHASILTELKYLLSCIRSYQCRWPWPYFESTACFLTVNLCSYPIYRFIASTVCVWEPIRKRAHTQFLREHSAAVVSTCWATLDWSWHKEWN